MPNTQVVEEKIKEYMTQQFLFEFDEISVTSETNLFSSGYIDSFGFVELITFLETEFEITFTDEELLSNSLNSLDSIVTQVEGKREYAI
ncbi:MAG: acyl carrier protein [Chloroflexota bacterium]